MTAEFRLINTTLVLPDRLVPAGAIHVRDGHIAVIGAACDLPAWQGATHDAGGTYASPGFVDMHVHGGDGADFMDGTIDAFLVERKLRGLHEAVSVRPLAADEVRVR